MGKYRGDSDDWLDNEESKNAQKKGHRKKPKPKEFRTNLPPNSTVIEVYPKLCRVRLDDTGAEWLCSYRRAEIYDADELLKNARQRSPVAVGDRVAVEATLDGEGIIATIAPRTNRLIRIAPDKDATVVHVVAANVDLLAIIASTRDPEFIPGIVDRFLIAAKAENIETIIVVNKIDLHDKPTKPWEMYQKLGHRVFEVSAQKNQGLEELRTALSNQHVVFSGHSGVGKTSLLRTLMDSKIGAVGTTNAYTGKGKHTTTSSFAYSIDAETVWIDTPGVREFNLYGIDPEQLRFLFPELGALDCPVVGCLHMGEENCVAENQPRLMSYRRIYASLLEKR